MSFSHSDSITLIQQQVRVLDAMLDIENDDRVALAMTNQKVAFEWVLELFGAEPADAQLIPSLREPEFDFTEFRRYCEANDIPAGSVDVEFIQWLYSEDNSMNLPTESRDSSSFVLDGVLSDAPPNRLMSGREVE